MKFSCEKYVLQQAALSTARAAASKSPIPTLEGLLIQAGEGVRLTMSCGMVSRRENPEESVSELCRIADKRMYDDKVRYYERTGATRRKE